MPGLQTGKLRHRVKVTCAKVQQIKLEFTEGQPGSSMFIPAMLHYQVSTHLPLKRQAPALTLPPFSKLPSTKPGTQAGLLNTE